MSGEVSITVTVPAYCAGAIIACAQLLEEDQPIMAPDGLRILADRLWGASIIPGSASPEGPSDDARPDMMPGFFDGSDDHKCDAYQWRMIAHLLLDTAINISAHLDKLGIERLGE